MKVFPRFNKTVVHVLKFQYKKYPIENPSFHLIGYFSTLTSLAAGGGIEWRFDGMTFPTVLIYFLEYPQLTKFKSVLKFM